MCVTLIAVSPSSNSSRAPKSKSNQITVLSYRGTWIALLTTFFMKSFINVTEYVFKVTLPSLVGTERPHEDIYSISDRFDLVRTFLCK